MAMSIDISAVFMGLQVCGHIKTVMVMQVWILMMMRIPFLGAVSQLIVGYRAGYSGL
jgi:hypothetical protein